MQAFSRLVKIMDELREQCPWDKKQTMESLRPLTIEEMYELTDAIIDKDLDELKKELGDVILHIVFYSKIASEQNAFDIEDVLNGICEKLIARHPHIYGNVKAENEEEVKANWEAIKLKEKGGNKTVLGGVPRSLPALVKAWRIQEKVKGVGFEWESSEDVWNKISEELQEFKKEIEDNDKEKAEKEFGDLLFSVINFGRFMGFNPENALEKTNLKFIRRFTELERVAKVKNRDLSEMSLSEMDKIWEEIKENEKRLP